jgi:hypothetical protein
MLWYFSESNKKNRLQVTQNKIRFVLKLDQSSNINLENFEQFGWLPVLSRVEQITLYHFKIHTGPAPFYVNEHFIPANSVHYHYTRFTKRSCFIIPKIKGLKV